MDGSHLGSQLSKDQLLPTQPLSSAVSSSLSQLQLQQQQQQQHHQHQQQHLLLQTRTGSQSILRTSRSPSATRSNEQTLYRIENKITNECKRDIKFCYTIPLCCCFV